MGRKFFWHLTTSLHVHKDLVSKKLVSPCSVASYFLIVIDSSQQIIIIAYRLYSQ